MTGPNVLIRERENAEDLTQVGANRPENEAIANQQQQVFDQDRGEASQPPEPAVQAAEANSNLASRPSEEVESTSREKRGAAVAARQAERMAKRAEEAKIAEGIAKTQALKDRLLERHAERNDRKAEEAAKAAQEAKAAAIHERATSPEVQALNDRAELEIYGSRHRTYVEPASGKEIASPDQPIKGKLVKMLSDPKYGASRQDREASVHEYQDDLSILLSQGFELCQAKLIMDMREADSDRRDAEVDRLIIEGRIASADHKRAREIHDQDKVKKEDGERQRLILEAGVFTASEFSRVQKGEDLYLNMQPNAALVELTPEARAEKEKQHEANEQERKAAIIAAREAYRDKDWPAFYAAYDKGLAAVAKVKDIWGDAWTEDQYTKLLNTTNSSQDFDIEGVRAAKGTPKEVSHRIEFIGNAHERLYEAKIEFDKAVEANDMGLALEMLTIAKDATLELSELAGWPKDRITLEEKNFKNRFGVDLFGATPDPSDLTAVQNKLPVDLDKGGKDKSPELTEADFQDHGKIAAKLAELTYQARKALNRDDDAKEAELIEQINTILDRAETFGWEKGEVKQLNDDIQANLDRPLTPRQRFKRAKSRLKNHLNINTNQASDAEQRYRRNRMRLLGAVFGSGAFLLLGQYIWGGGEDSSPTPSQDEIEAPATAPKFNIEDDHGPTQEIQDLFPGQDSAQYAAAHHDAVNKFGKDYIQGVAKYEDPATGELRFAHGGEANLAPEVQKFFEDRFKMQAKF